MSFRSLRSRSFWYSRKNVAPAPLPREAEEVPVEAPNEEPIVVPAPYEEPIVVPERIVEYPEVTGVEDTIGAFAWNGILIDVAFEEYAEETGLVDEAIGALIDDVIGLAEYPEVTGLVENGAFGLKGMLTEVAREEAIVVVEPRVFPTNGMRPMPEEPNVVATDGALVTKGAVPTLDPKGRAP